MVNFYHTSEVDCLYIFCHLGGRGLNSACHCVEMEKHSLGVYISSSDEPLLCLVALIYTIGFLLQMNLDSNAKP